MHIELDTRAHHAVGRLRLLGAIAVIGSGGLLAAQGAGPAGWVLLFFGGLVALGWLAVWWRGRHVDPQEHWLRLDADALRMRRGEKLDEVSWTSIETIEADEDALVVRVERTGADPLKVPLVWEGFGLYELEAALERARRAACDT